MKDLLNNPLAIVILCALPLVIYLTFKYLEFLYKRDRNKKMDRSPKHSVEQPKTKKEMNGTKKEMNGQKVDEKDIVFDKTIKLQSAKA